MPFTETPFLVWLRPLGQISQDVAARDGPLAEVVAQDTRSE